eukprot:TRINITY_DN7245_c0_g2_i3.p1 TRINITY_DN7245_c0_g2~~TRINITY_DN7245_c0_g2_i3.p1  ORF type:complete len:829 (-),score=172.02 TRINITY_DN7245_c0_g2_i3:376-2862(-)
MKVEKQEDDEFEMLLDEIPHATSSPLLHHYEKEQQQQKQKHQHDHHVHDVHGGHVDLGHGFSRNPTLTNLGMYDDDPSNHLAYVCASPASGVSLQSEGSSSSSLSGYDGSPSPSPIKYQMLSRKAHNQNGIWLSRESEPINYPVGKNFDRSGMDELSNQSKELELLNYSVGKNFDGSGMDELSNKLWKMRVREEEEDAVRSAKLVTLGNSVDPYGFLRPSIGVNHGNMMTNNPFEDGRNGFSNDRGLFRWQGVPNSAPVDDERRLSMSRLLQHCNVGNNLSGLGLTQQYDMINLTGSCLPPNQSVAPFPYSCPYNDMMNFSQTRTRESDEVLSKLHLYAEDGYGRSCYGSRTQVSDMANHINRASVPDAVLLSHQKRMDSDGNWVGLNLPSSPRGTLPEVSPNMGNLSHCSYSNGWFPQPPSSLRCPLNLEAFCCEDSYIIPGKDSNYVVKDGHNLAREHRRCSHNNMSRGHSSAKNSEMDVGLHSNDGHILRIHDPPLLPQNYSSLREVQGYIYFIAKDQHGCRFLQRKFDEGTPQDIQMIFNEIIDHAIELMMNPFGNYLMQKLLDVCTEEQRMQILLVVTEFPGDLVKISLNTHGTRSVQKLLETLKTRQQISLVVSALELGFLDLIKDLNGNHVVQRCLQCLSNEDNKFIFDAAAKYCVDIATHRHGCCVLQRCIFYSTGEYRENLVAEISANGLLLAQDAFGNYVVQYILELKIPSAIANLISQFEGNYTHLSTQKFSSNVVEKCLKVLGEESRSRIIHELLSSSQFEQLLQDPYANYVIHSALLVSKGPLHASLVEAIRPHAAVLRTSPYCKRIFSRALLKK